MNRPVLTLAGHDKFTRPTPQEVVERLAGGTTWREPMGSFGLVPSLACDDIAFALATAHNRDQVMHSRLARALACSVATRTTRLWPEVHAYGVPHLLAACGSSRKHRVLVMGEHRVRVQIVLFDAYRALVSERLLPVHARARTARMRRRSYRALYDFIFAEISALADVVMADAVSALTE